MFCCNKDNIIVVSYKVMYNHYWKLAWIKLERLTQVVFLFTASFFKAVCCKSYWWINWLSQLSVTLHTLILIDTDFEAFQILKKIYKLKTWAVVQWTMTIRKQNKATKKLFPSQPNWICGRLINKFMAWS